MSRAVLLFFKKETPQPTSSQDDFTASSQTGTADYIFILSGTTFLDPSLHGIVSRVTWIGSARISSTWNGVGETYVRTRTPGPWENLCLSAIYLVSPCGRYVRISLLGTKNRFIRFDREEMATFTRKYFFCRSNSGVHTSFLPLEKMI